MNILNKTLLIIFDYYFKFGDVVAGVMANPFYNEIRFSNIDIANASMKCFGVIMTIIESVYRWLYMKM